MANLIIGIKEGGNISKARTIISHSPEDTQAIGKKIGSLAQAGDVYLLIGDLGAGKTCLTQGIAIGLGIREHTSSPSFVLLKEYRGRLALYHIDLYRLNNTNEIADLGLDDYLYGEGVSVVEWADKGISILPQEYLLIRIRHLSETERQLSFDSQGERYSSLVDFICN